MSLLHNNSVFGLDIGFETIKMVEIRREKTGHKLVGAIEIPLKDRILQKDQFKNKADTANQIKEAMRKAKPSPITAAKIITALPETFVFSKTLKMPKISQKELESAVPLEAAEYLPIPIEDVYLDFQILVTHPDEPQIDVLAVAAPKKLVDDYVDMAHLADLELFAIETKPLSVGRALLPKDDKAGTILLHIGTEYSRLAIWDSGTLKMSSTITTGQNQILENLGILPGQKISGIGEKELRSSSVLSTIIDDVISGIKYHNNRDYKPEPIKKIIICGSSSSIPELDKYFQKELSIPTQIAKIKIGKDELPPQYIAAYGLALRDLNE